MADGLKVTEDAAGAAGDRPAKPAEGANGATGAHGVNGANGVAANGAHDAAANGSTNAGTAGRPLGADMDADRRTREPVLTRATRPIPTLLPHRDMRRKRPPALSFLLRLATLRRLLRVVVLLAL